MKSSLKFIVLLFLITCTSIVLAAGKKVGHNKGVQDLIDATGGKAKVSLDRQTGLARFIQLPQEPVSAATTDGPEPTPLAPAQQRAEKFLKNHGKALGIKNVDTELKAVGTTRGASGNQHSVFKQIHEGLPVFGGEVRAHFNANGDMFAVNGTFVSYLKVNTDPSLSADEASLRAMRAVTLKQYMDDRVSIKATDNAVSPNEDLDSLDVAATKLMVFRTGLVQGVAGQDHLAYEVEVTNAEMSVREFVYVDAHSGEVLDQITGIHDAMYRRAYDGQHLPNVPPEYPGTPFWEEADPLPTGVTEADNMIYASEETYDLFFNAFGRDSFDGAGAMMDSIFNRGYGCPNASWNGVFISFCPGFTTDDITGHEWGHAYTDYTNNLIYQWQSGALNESYSDIWGEIVDLINGRGVDLPHDPRTDGSCSLQGPGASGDNSVRWLMGEESSIGALRDMWNPNCAGDPASVTDPLYYCSSGDNGGVHYNSGIPNRAFSLMVDGGTFNGYSDAGIGLNKAAHIEWAAQNMLTPASNFVDNADALDAACSSLIGVDVLDLVTGAPSGEVIDAGDCAQVAAINDAVEFRTFPDQCGFEPVLEPGAPALCEGLGSVQTTAFEDFEGGTLPAGWTVGSHDLVNAPEFTNSGWEVVGSLPSGNGSAFAAFGPNPIVGDCSISSEAGVINLDSPAIVLPVSEPPHVAFDHYVATEGGWDGGNLKISVNGGPWTVVPSSAYSFNAYNAALNASDNPMGGEEAFTGADGGVLNGSWGQSQVDLLWVANPGDTVQFRFDLGSDGCNGLDGWYVDNFEVYSCDAEEFPVCGNGVLGAGQQCDDGNTWDHDGCSSSCQIEEGWVCADPVAGEGSMNVVTDWSFEDSFFTTDWTATSTFGGIAGFPLCGPDNGCPAASLANTGSWLVWVGGLSGGVTSTVDQDITIPAAATDLTLLAWRGVCDDPSDTLHVSLDGADIGTIACDGTDGGWVEHSFPVAPFNDGGSHNLMIGGTVGGTNGTHSNFFVEDVVLSDNTPTPSVPSACERIVTDLACGGGTVKFIGGIADSWTVVDNEGYGIVWTDIESAQIGGNWTGGDGEAASVNSDPYIFTDYDTELISNPFSLANVSAASLDYLANFQNIGADMLDVDITMDGGNNWTNLLSWNEDHGGFFSTPGEAVSIDLADYLGQTNLQVRWHYYNPAIADWDWYAQVDNVLLNVPGDDDCDNDGVENSLDYCTGTVIPESVPTKKLGQNRWALEDGDGVFDTKGKQDAAYTIDDTAGCSCEQIIENLDLGDGHTKFGCSNSAMKDWIFLMSQ